VLNFRVVGIPSGKVASTAFGVADPG